MRSDRFHPEALAEYEAAAVWYADRSPEAALAFVDLIGNAIDEVRAMPETWGLWAEHQDARRRTLRSVPYSSIYLVEPDELLIVAIAHHRRRPGYWQRRVAR